LVALLSEPFSTVPTGGTTNERTDEDTDGTAGSDYKRSRLGAGPCTRHASTELGCDLTELNCFTTAALQKTVRSMTNPD
jgi:hypothetical protein